jgi:hypothetical protein
VYLMERDRVEGKADAIASGSLQLLNRVVVLVIMSRRQITVSEFGNGES